MAFTIVCEEGAILQGDREHITQALCHLAQNAWTWSPPTEAVGVADQEWEPGSWSRLETSGAADVEETISLADEPARHTAPHIIAEPVTGSGRDRYLQDLDDAVNPTDDSDDEAMTAFFEGSTDSRNRRFGWRR